jgi:hypothetical protein
MEKKTKKNKMVIIGGILVVFFFIWVVAIFKAGKDQPLDINARDRYRNSK